jgi:ATP-dependent Lon protease
LEKQIAKVVRYAAKNLAMNLEYNSNVKVSDLNEILGSSKLDRTIYENNKVAGVVTGLAWTRVGGDILFIESIISKGKGKLSITGNLGKVMSESATIALEFIKANSKYFKIKDSVFENYNIHIHVPEGATPKDGPSAGITMLTSLVSLLTQKRVNKNLAMTGEITLRGKVLPVGGIKEKILAAKRAKITDIILCKQNESDVDEVKKDYLKGLKFHYVTDMKEVIKLALSDQDVLNVKKL